MGSLMAGWNAPTQDPKTVKLQRNRSLTKEGIETYWRSKKKKEEEDDMDTREEKYMRSTSMPLPASNSNKNENLVETHEERMEKLLKKNGWWISSKWAFLNEPPVISTEAPTYKYASQYHVATTTPTSTPPPTKESLAS